MANKKEYDTFVDDPETFPLGEEVEIVVRDLTPGLRKYNSRYVLGVVNTPEAMPDGDTLWLRYTRGMLYPRAYALKIVRELGEYKVTKTPVRT